MSLSSNPTPSEPAWVQELRTIATGPYPDWLPLDVAEELRLWLERFAFYEQCNETEYKSIHQWKKNHKVKSAAHNLLRAVNVLKDLHAAQKKPPSYNLMQQATIDIIKLKLIRMEIVQYKLLEHAQHVNRQYIWQSDHGAAGTLSIKQTKAKLYAWHDEMRKYKHFKTYIKEAKQAGLHSSARLFKRYKRGFYFNADIEKADQASRGFNLLNAINHLLLYIASYTSTLMNALNVVANVCTAIPIVSAFISGIPIVITAADAWLNKRSRITRATSIAGVALVIGGLITTGFGTLAAVIVAVAFTAIGVVKDRIVPFVKVSRQLYSKQKELIELRDTHAQFQMSGDLPRLNWREKNFIVVAIERQWLNKNSDHAELAKIRDQVLQAGSLADLSIIKGLPAILGKDSKSYLLEQMKKRDLDLTLDISEYKHEKRLEAVKLTNSTLALIGAILTCIPTPVTLGIGAGLLLFTAIAGIIIEFKVIEKISAAIAKRREKPMHTAISETTTTDKLAPTLTKQYDSAKTAALEENSEKKTAATPPTPAALDKEDEGDAESESPRVDIKPPSR